MYFCSAWACESSAKIKFLLTLIRCTVLVEESLVSSGAWHMRPLPQLQKASMKYGYFQMLIIFPLKLRHVSCSLNISVILAGPVRALPKFQKAYIKCVCYQLSNCLSVYRSTGINHTIIVVTILLKFFNLCLSTFNVY